MTKVLVDTRISGKDGIGRYTREMAKALIAHQSHSLSFLTRDKMIIPSGYKVYEDRSVHYSIEEVKIFDKILNLDKCDVIHCFDYRVPLDKGKKKLVVTIHDVFRFIDQTLCYEDQCFLNKIGEDLYKNCEKLISFYDKPSNFMKDVRYVSMHHKYYSYLLSHAIKTADIIIVPSKSVKADIVANFKVSEDSIHVIYHGLDHLPLNDETHKRKKSSFFLYVGQNRPHKNCSLLIECFQEFLKKTCYRDLKLLLVGKDFKKNQLSSENNIESIGYKDDQELVELIKQATALVHIPRFEGFGFTPAEALTCGTQVIASDIAVLREILGDSPIFIDLDNPKSLIEAFETVTYGHPKDLSFPLKQRTWAETVQEVAPLYDIL